MYHKREVVSKMDGELRYEKAETRRRSPEVRSSTRDEVRCTKEGSEARVETRAYEDE